MLHPGHLPINSLSALSKSRAPSRSYRELLSEAKALLLFRSHMVLGAQNPARRTPAEERVASDEMEIEKSFLTSVELGTWSVEGGMSDVAPKSGGGWHHAPGPTLTAPAHTLTKKHKKIMTTPFLTHFLFLFLFYKKYVNT